MGIGNTYEGQPGLRQLAPWLAIGVHTRLARCHHKSSCASTTPRTVFKPQSERKTPWRARCFSGMRWSGCGTALQHPSNRSSVPFVDARQHRDRAWYIEAIYEPSQPHSPVNRMATGRDAPLLPGRHFSPPSACLPGPKHDSSSPRIARCR